MLLQTLYHKRESEISLSLSLFDFFLYHYIITIYYFISFSFLSLFHLIKFFFHLSSLFLFRLRGIKYQENFKNSYLPSIQFFFRSKPELKDAVGEETNYPPPLKPTP